MGKPIYFAGLWHWNSLVLLREPNSHLPVVSTDPESLADRVQGIGHVYLLSDREAVVECPDLEIDTTPWILPLSDNDQDEIKAAFSVLPYETPLRIRLLLERLRPCDN